MKLTEKSLHVFNYVKENGGRVTIEAICEGLALFTGTGRRFEKVGVVRGATLIDDYAHHPTEIAATLAAARASIAEGGHVLAIFQAHTYSRALAFKEEFSAALGLADRIFVADIYAAREPDPGTISGKMMADDFVRAGLPASYEGDFEAIARAVSAELRSGDLIISLGAGDVNKILKMIR
jgi:UDP-N-acetylmuramate--alanine ligase